MTFRVGPPAPASGFRNKDHEGDLLIFVQPVLEKEVETPFGNEDDAARCTYVICIDEMDLFTDSLVFGRALVPRLTDAIEEIAVGRIGQGDAQPNKNAPWVLIDPTPDELKQAEDIMNAVARKNPDGTIVVDRKALASLRAPRTDDEF